MSIYEKQKLYDLQTAYAEEIRPWINLKCNIMAMAMPTLLITDDSLLPERRDDGLSAELKATVARIDEVIESIGARYKRYMKK
jgi:hypothetical protein